MDYVRPREMLSFHGGIEKINRHLEHARTTSFRLEPVGSL